MQALTTTGSGPAVDQSTLRTAGRWMVSFVGFPLGGLTASLVAGPVDGPVAAAVGGLITGTAVGALQAWGLGRHGPSARRWITATAVGLTVGLVVGAAAVGYATSLSALLVQGAVCGAAVGAAQAVVLRGLLGRLAAVWPLALAVVWALGWAITTTAGIQVEEQFTVFGSSGAIVVTALTAALPLLLAHRERAPR